MKDVCVLPFWVLHCIESISTWYGLNIQWMFAEQMTTDEGEVWESNPQHS